jgi:serine/threonine-protein kinase
LGATLQTQGQLDGAFAQFRKCPADDVVLEQLYQLGLDYESARKFAKAVSVYEYMAAFRSGYRDIRERRTRLKSLMVGPRPASGTSPAKKTVLLDASSIERPTLAHYRLEQELGKGAMAVVYLALDLNLGRHVALKTLSLNDEFEGEELEDAEQRFAREAEASARLSHPNIVTIYEAGKDHDLAYIAMDYVEGESLESFTDDEALLPVREVLEIGAQVAEALDYAHENQIVHRDVKPSNIIYVRDSGTVKVTDFGIAHLTNDSQTRTGAVLGTPSYMSPEQAAGQRVDGRTDLFSLGVTIYQLLTGRLPFVGDSLANLIYRIATEKPQGIRKLRPGLNSSLSRVVNRALQKDPEKRFSSGKMMAEALLKCREQIRDDPPLRRQS